MNEESKPRSDDLNSLPPNVAASPAPKKSLPPDPAAEENARGLALFAKGEYSAAAAVFRDALARYPDNARLHNNLGLALHKAAKLEDAEKSFRHALKLQPEYPIALNNLGSLLHGMQRSEDSIVPLREAMRLDPNYPEAHFNLGNALHALGDLTGASASLREAVRLRPEYVKAHHQLGLVYMGMNQPPRAVASFEAAVKLKPDWAEAWLSLGTLLLQVGEWVQARPVVERALALKQDLPGAQAYRVMLNDMQCQWKTRTGDWDALWQTTLRELAEGKTTSVGPFQSLTAPWPAERHLRIARSHAEAILRRSEPPRRGVNFGYRRERARDGRLRIGYISGDLRAHPVGYLTRSLFGLHDRKSFNIFCYSHGPDDGSAQRRDIVRGCDIFRDIGALSVADAARQIHADGIDVLVELMGHTGQTRLGIAALRPAPVQAVWLGYAGTLGAEFIDYLIADPCVLPPDRAADFVEKPVLLPPSYIVADHQRPIAENVPTRAAEGLPDDAFVFCAFANSYKVEPVIFGAWMRILRQVPGSVLWVNLKDPAALQNLQNEASAAGVAPERLVAANWAPDNAVHLARHRLAGLFLDTHFYNAHTGAVDALWAGLPVLSWPGESMVSRAGASLLTAAGLPELIAKDCADYERMAVRIATDAVALQSLKARLAEHRRSCALFDTAGFARKLERAYAAMWENYAAGKPAHLIELHGAQAGFSR